MLARDAIGEGVQQQVAERVRRRVGGRLRVACAGAGAIASRPGRSRPARPRWRPPATRPARNAASACQRAASASRARARSGSRASTSAARSQASARSPASLRRQQHRRQARMRAEREHAPAQRGDRARRRARRAAAAVRAPRPARPAAAHRRSAGSRRPRRPVPAPAPASSTCAISGRRCGSSRCDCGHSRYAQPSATRPARPARWSAEACAIVDHVQPREAAVGVVARLARQAAVDHHAHAGQGHAGFGDVGRQHDAAAAVGIGLQHARLLLDRQLAVQRQHVDVGASTSPAASAASHARDLALAGQEHQHVAGMLRQRLLDRAPRLRLELLVAPRGEVRDRHRIAAARRCSAAARRGTRPGARHRASPTSPRCAGPRASCACTSSASARPRSAARWRSWNSSNSSAPTPSSVGSSWIMRVRMPSVTHLDPRARRTPCSRSGCGSRPSRRPLRRAAAP